MVGVEISNLKIDESSMKVKVPTSRNIGTTLYRETYFEQSKMSLIRNITSIFKKITSNKSSKNIIVNVVRTNKSFSGSIKIPKSKDKEPGELIKWVLLV